MMLKMKDLKFLLLPFSAILHVLHGAPTNPQRVELAPCDGDQAINCMLEDDTSSFFQLGHDITAKLKMRLPTEALGEIISDLSKVAIVSFNTDITRGRHIIDPNYGNRLKINFNLEPSGLEWGVLKIELSLQTLQYADERHLQLQVRTEDVIYDSKGKVWFPVIAEMDLTTEPPSDTKSDQGTSEKGILVQQAWQEVQEGMYQMESKIVMNNTAQHQENILKLQDYIDSNLEKIKREVLQSHDKFVVMDAMIMIILLCLCIAAVLFVFKIKMAVKPTSNTTFISLSMTSGEQHVSIGWGSKCIAPESDGHFEVPALKEQYFIKKQNPSPELVPLMS